MSDSISLPDPRLIHIIGCLECALLGGKVEPMTRQRLQNALKVLTMPDPDFKKWSSASSVHAHGYDEGRKQ